MKFLNIINVKSKLSKSSLMIRNKNNCQISDYSKTFAIIYLELSMHKFFRCTKDNNNKKNLIKYSFFEAVFG